MSNKTKRSLFYSSIVLLVLVSISGGSNAENSQCSVKKETNTIVNIKASKAKNPSTKVLAGLLLKTESSCMDKCCGEPQCTIYVYYDSANRPSNCFLLNCTPTSKCVRSNLSGSVVGTVERNSLIQESIAASPIDNSKLHTMSTLTSKDGIMLETTLSETPIGTTSSSPQQLEQRGEGPSRNSSVPHSIASTPPVASVHYSTLTSTPATTPQATTPQATTPKVHIKTKHPTEGHDHTNKTSLIIALFFGILFLLAVVVIVGRPWWDFMQRPRYSKVDYLMNGL